jgi:MazG family protein
VKKLLTMMAQLRNPETGCSWHQQQTYTQLSSHTLEQAHEIAAAIERNDSTILKQELGDLLSQIVLYAHIAQEQHDFDFADIVTVASEKMLQRPPHTPITNDNSSRKTKNNHNHNYKQYKQGDFFADISATLSSLQRGQKILDRASQTGFDWDNWRPIITKVQEELDEIIDAIDNKESQARIEEEVGDLFIASTNLARHLNVNAEEATRKAGDKFARRFNQLQQTLATIDPEEKDPTLEQMEVVWQQVKCDEKRPDIHEAAYECLMLSGNVKNKRMHTNLLNSHWQEGKYQRLAQQTPVERIEIPGRPEKPQLVAPKKLKQRSLNTEEGRASLIHAITHIEFNAINLALDAVYRFRDMPDEYYTDWLQVAAEEAYHFSLLEERLQQLGYQYGDMPAHNGLWEMAVKTDHDVLVRMALVPRVLEARGLDVTPGIMNKLELAGDLETVAILKIILRDEINHVRIGSHWFHYCCQQRNLDADKTFQQQLQQYMSGSLRGPFHHEARLQAGFSMEEMKQLERLSK